MMDAFSAFKKARYPEIEAALRQYSDKFLSAAPLRLKEAITYSLLSPGKRLRPLMVLMATEACGGDPGRALPAACAVEAVHVFSLIHDDLPAMDDDDLRRGKPASHKVFGEAEAILAGDALLALPFEIISSEISDTEVAATCCRVLAKAAGAAGICGGQSDDLRGSPDIESVHRMKTAALFEASAHLGAITGGGSPEQIQALREFGSLLGSAFQIADDLKDDSKKDKVSYVKKFGKENAGDRLNILVDAAKNALGVFGKEADSLRDLANNLTALNI